MACPFFDLLLENESKRMFNFMTHTVHTKVCALDNYSINDSKIINSWLYSSVHSQSKVKNDSQRSRKCIRMESMTHRFVSKQYKLLWKQKNTKLQCWHASFSFSFVRLHTFILPWHIENNAVCDFNCDRETKRSILLQTGTKIALNSGHSTKSTHKICIQIPNPECVCVVCLCVCAVLQHFYYTTNF